MLGSAALQREILAAIDDKEALRAIAVREGIDPRLWDYWIGMTEIVNGMTREMNELLDGVTKSDASEPEEESAK